MEVPENCPLSKEQLEVLFAETLSERIFHGHLTVQQFETVLIAIRDTDINMDSFFLRITPPSDSDSDGQHALEDPDLMASAYEVMLYPSFNVVHSSVKTNKYIGYITMDQLNSVLDAIRDNDNKMKGLRLEVNDISHVDSQLLATAFTKLKSLSLCGEAMGTQEQVNAFFSAMVHNKNVNLKHFQNEYSAFGKTDIDTMAEALTKMESATIVRSLAPKQVEGLFAKIKDKEDFTLKRLDIQGNYLQPVDPTVMVSALSKLETVNLRGTSLTTGHLEALFTAITEGDVTLKNLDIGDNDCAKPNMDLMASALCKLETAVISLMDLESSEVDTILTAIRDTEGIALKNLDMRDTELTDVQDGLMASAFSKLETVSVLGTRYWDIGSVLTAIKNGGTKLKSLDLGKQNMQEVDSELFAEAVCKLETACFFASEITPHQMKTLFATFNEDCRLKNLDLGGNVMESLEPELLASAVTKLERCFLLGTEMTGEQINTLLKQVLEQTSLKSLKFSWAEGADENLVRQARGVVENLDVFVLDLNQIC